MAQARTGTGKTAAYVIPLLEGVRPRRKSPGPGALVLVPTRELAVQVKDEVEKLSRGRKTSCVALYGGKPIKSQIAKLQAGADIIVGTPGRVLDHLGRNTLDLRGLAWVVLDEADRMLDIGFRPDIEKILRRCPSQRQTLLLSATVPPPVERLARRYMNDPLVLNFSPLQPASDTIDQYYFTVDQEKKFPLLVRLLEREQPEQAIVFCRTKIGTARLDRTLRDRGMRVKALHGDMSQGQRDGVMLAFKGRRLPILVATDVAARGLDIEHVTHVVNYDIPNSPEIYVHRIGRTGRVGRTGRAITFVTPAQREEIGVIERHAKTRIDEWEPPEERLRHAPDPRRRDHERDGNGAAPSEADAPAAGRAKVFVNRGKGSGISDDDIRWALTEGAVIPDEAIDSIRVLDRFSFVELAADQAERAVEFLDGTKLKGKQIRMEVARS
jgi:ATP-dependent RNA helicase DeaD